MTDVFTQAYTCAAASLTGHASNVTGASWTIATATAGDGLAHKVTIRNDTANDHSAKTVVLAGLGPNGEPLTETMAAPGISATVTSTLYYKSLTVATPSATIGADTFDIGWTAAAQSQWVGVNKTPSAGAVYVSGTINYDLQHSYEGNATTASLYPFNSEAGKTAAVDHGYTTPIKAVRVNVNSHTGGTFVLNVVV
jgi:hypothetical protein